MKTTAYSQTSSVNSLSLDGLAEMLWKLPSHDLEAVEDMVERKFVRTVLNRAQEIPRLRKQGKLLSLADLKRVCSA